MTKKALVLAGGGTRGSYQNGAIHALRRLGQDDWDIVTGTSIGALNAVLVVQKDYREMDRLWSTLTQDRIVNGAISMDMDINDMINERSQLVPFIREFIKDKGADITPMIHNITRLYSPERFFASPVDFGCIVCQQGSRKPVFVTKEMMRENGVDWLVSTASAYPAFPVHHFSEGDFIDGGYYDNLPIDYALRMGAEEVIAIDLSSNPHHPNYFNRTGFTYIFPQIETGSFLSFDRGTIERLETLGYYDTMKVFGVFDGVKYTFEKMELPSWYGAFSLELLMLEERISRANEIASRLFSPQAVTDRLASQQHQKVLSDKRMFFGLMDNLMTMCGLDVERVWTYREARNEILARFADCAGEDYSYLPESLTTSHLLSYAATLGSKGIVEKLFIPVSIPATAS